MLDPWAAALSPDDFQRAFAVATAPLMAGFDTSLDRGDGAPATSSAPPCSPRKAR